ncbi:MAG: polysaccharide deacetylase family protein [Candidatus Buchananbacteria bacterium]
MFNITTSWDDGNKLDLKLLELLNTYALKGTFYIPKKFDLKSLTDSEVIRFSNEQEVGGHTINHVKLTDVENKIAASEVRESKIYLENMLGKNIKMFCYPVGKYNSDIKEMVKNAGFLGARTAKQFSFGVNDSFEFNPTIQVYPFPMRKKDKDSFHLSRFLFDPVKNSANDILRLKLPMATFLSWPNLGKNLFDYFLKHGGVFHIWGHSWEIERYGMWSELEELFKYVSNRPNCTYLTNSQILENKSSEYYEGFNS